MSVNLESDLWSSQFSRKTNEKKSFTLLLFTTTQVELVSFVFGRIKETISCFRDSFFFVKIENI